MFSVCLSRVGHGTINNLNLRIVTISIDIIGEDQPRNNATAAANNNNNALATTATTAVSPINVGIEDFLKDHKTLNVNMNITDTAADGSMNNKINFDRLDL